MTHLSSTNRVHSRVYPRTFHSNPPPAPPSRHPCLPPGVWNRFPPVLPSFNRRLLALPPVLPSFHRRLRLFYGWAAPPPIPSRSIVDELTPSHPRITSPVTRPHLPTFLPPFFPPLLPSHHPPQHRRGARPAARSAAATGRERGARARDADRRARGWCVTRRSYPLRLTTHPPL